MKNKTRIPRKLPVSKEVSLPEPALKTDELIDFLDRSYQENAKLTLDATFEAILVLLFLQKVMDQDEPVGALTIHLKDRTVDFADADNAVAAILELCIPRLWEARNLTDERELKVSAAVRRYREVHPNGPSA